MTFKNVNPYQTNIIIPNSILYVLKLVWKGIFKSFILYGSRVHP